MSKTCKKSLWTLSSSQSGITRYGVGLDVHKYKIAVCITAQLQTGDIVTVKEHLFRATPDGLIELVNFLKKFTPVSCYLMECTGVYHIPIYHALQQAFPDRASQVFAMNPLMLHRRIGDLGQHADRTDAQGLSTLTHYDNLIRPSYVGSLSFIRLKQTIRLFHRNKTQVTRIRNRIHQILDAENFKFKLDLGSEWGLRLLDMYISRNWNFKESFEWLVNHLHQAGKGIQVYEKRRPDIQEYATAILNETSRFLLQMHLSNLLYEEGQSAIFLLQADQLVLQDLELSETYEKLLQIPSFGSVTALTILAEIGDYHRFATWQAFTKYCGVVPIINQSGEHRAKGHVNKYSNALLRKVLTQSAANLINICRRDSDLAKYAHYQYRGRNLPYKKALLKVGHKLARTTYNVLMLQIDYDPNFEYVQKRLKAIKNKKMQKGTLIESFRTRAIRRNVSKFLVLNYEFLNSTSKYHLISGFNRMIQKAKYLESKKKQQTEPKEGKK